MAEKKKTSGTKAKKDSAKKSPAKKAVKKAAVQKAAPKKAKTKKPEAAQAVASAGVEALALARFVRISPQKARLVIDLIRGQGVGPALTTLQFTKKRAARPIEKVLRSAIANAEQKDENVDVDRLYVKHAVVNEGFRYKRMRPRMRGMAVVFYRRTSHIEIAVAETRAAARTA